MSLEAKIELLTAAVIELTAAIGLQQPGAVHFTAHNQIDPKAAVPNVSAPTAAGAVGSSNAKAAEAPNAKPETPTPTTSTSLDSSNESAPVRYDDVKAVTIAVTKIDKAKAVAGLARFGAKNAKELQELQWSEYVEYMKDVLNCEHGIVA